MELKIRVTGSGLTINENTWDAAPPIDNVLSTVGSSSLIDGGFVVVQGKQTAQFKYFEDLGLSLLETIPSGKVRRVSIHTLTPPSKSQSPRSRYLPYGTVGERSTKLPFDGQLELNNKQLSFPLRIKQFPMRGELLFIHRIAIGIRIDAAVHEKSGFVTKIIVEFKG